MSALADAKRDCFQLKGSLFTLTALELHDYAPDLLNEQLERKVSQAPKFFQHAPIVLSLDKLADSIDVDLAELQRICQQQGLLPVGIKGGSNQLQEQAAKLGLAKLSASKSQASSEPKPSIEKSQERPLQPVTVDKPAPTSKLVTQPVRSGQQIYAPGGDLIVTAPVSPGAEILADGNIHVYAALRGRALAGVQGNIHARIFCYDLQAELVSIAGQYQLSDELRQHCWQQQAQVFLQDEVLHVTALS